MKRFLFICLCTLCVHLSYSQNVTNVQFTQEGKNVRITYSLDDDADVSVEVSTDGGKTFSGSLRHVTGDVGNGISAGNKNIIWDALAEYEKIVGGDICFRVNAMGGKQKFTVNGVSFTMIKVQGGTFTMGATDSFDNEKPPHQVTLSSYSIGETEVTQALWKAVMGNNPSLFKGDKLPVEEVSWNKCQAFISKLNSLTGKRFRFPTEAEWEYAARGGQKSKGYKYSGSNNIDDVAWHYDNSGSSTHNVATKQPNELGLYDMSGNVFEWCSDRYGDYSINAQTNPKGSSDDSFYVYRGGSWGNSKMYCRVSNRRCNRINYWDKYLGLRLVLSE